MEHYVAVIRRKPDEDIEHWKYVKREKVNGKWKYWYKDAVNNVADKLGVDERERLKNKESELEYKIAKEKQSESDMLDQAVRVEFNGYRKDVNDAYKKLVSENTQDLKEIIKAREEVRNFAEEYANTPLGKLENAVDSGIEFVAKIMGINAIKEYVNDRKEKQADENDAKRRDDIAKEALNKQAKYKKAHAKNQYIARKKAEEKEADRLQKQMIADAVAKKRRVKAQYIARKKAEEKEAIRLKEESARRVESKARRTRA